MRFDIHDPEGALRARTAHAEDAAVLVATFEDGTTIRSGGRVLWTEGAEDLPAFESYDHVSEVCHRRLKAATEPKGEVTL